LVTVQAFSCNGHCHFCTFARPVFLLLLHTGGRGLMAVSPSPCLSLYIYLSLPFSSSYLSIYLSIYLSPSILSLSLFLSLSFSLSHSLLHLPLPLGSVAAPD